MNVLQSIIIFSFFFFSVFFCLIGGDVAQIVFEAQLDPHVRWSNFIFTRHLSFRSSYTFVVYHSHKGTRIHFILLSVLYSSRLTVDNSISLSRFLGFNFVKLERISLFVRARRAFFSLYLSCRPSQCARSVRSNARINRSRSNETSRFQSNPIIFSIDLELRGK